MVRQYLSQTNHIVVEKRYKNDVLKLLFLFRYFYNLFELLVRVFDFEFQNALFAVTPANVELLPQSRNSHILHRIALLDFSDFTQIFVQIVLYFDIFTENTT